MKQDIEYNGIQASTMGLLISKEINIPSPEPNVTETKIAGRDGSLITPDGSYKDIKIKVSINYVEHGGWGETYRSAKKWLRSKGNGRLRFTRPSEYFYKVKKVEIGDDGRSTPYDGKFDVTFICDPYTYLNSGLLTIGTGTVKNQWETCHPEYQITGEGMCTLIVNGNLVRANVGQNLTIDTERMLAYREDGTIANTSITGDYEDLYLQPGANTIRATSGFALKVIPNWRCL